MSNSVQIAHNPVGRKINWYEIYILVNHWKSDLEFYQEDIRFLQQLIQKYLIWITKKENMAMVAEIRKKEHELSIKGEQLQQDVHQHMASVVDAIEGKKVDPDEFISRHGHLERQFSEFVGEFREKRKEVFKVTEYVMDSEELQNILKP